MNNHDLAWIAGFLEGEGVFSTHISSRGFCKIRISASSTDADVLEHLTSLVAGSHVYGPRMPHAHSLGKKPFYVWVLQIKPLAVDLATQLRPNMGERRREQIDKMLADAAAYPVVRNRNVRAEHGTTTCAWRGCPCRPCREADNRYQRERRAALKSQRTAPAA